MGVPERSSSDLASVLFHRAGTQADGGAMEASSGIAERSTTQGVVRSIILLLYREAVAHALSVPCSHSCEHVF
jgi:hypothetical protein